MKARARLGIALILVTAASVSPRLALAAIWPNETAMKNETLAALRETYVYDPTAGKVIGGCSGVSCPATYSTFASTKFVSYYKKWGFDRNFMVWAPIVSRYNAGSASWSRCDTTTQHPNDFCPTSATIRFATVSSTIGDNRITVKLWNGHFIATVCGNFSTSGAYGPVPTITGTKYLDSNANGRRDPGEPGLPGWTIELDYNGNKIASTTTDSNGAYAFRLDANTLPISAGTYGVREVLKPQWSQTAAPHPISIPYGAADVVYSGNDFGNAPSMWGRAVGLRQGGLPAPVPSSLSDTGPVIRPDSGTVQITLLDVPANPVVSGKVFRSRVTTKVGGDSQADSQLAEVVVTVGGHTIVARAVEAESHTSCDDSGTGETTMAFLSVDGTPLADLSPGPNTSIALAGGVTVTLNEQFAALGDGFGLPGRVFVVKAIHVVVPGVEDLVLAEAVSGSACA